MRKRARSAAIIDPSGRVENVSVVSRPRSGCGAHSVTSATRLGRTPPSPMPVANRIAAIVVRFGANAVRAVPASEDERRSNDRAATAQAIGEAAHRERTHEHARRVPP